MMPPLVFYLGGALLIAAMATPAVLDWLERRRETKSSQSRESLPGQSIRVSAQRNKEVANGVAPRSNTTHFTRRQPRMRPPRQRLGSATPSLVDWVGAVARIRGTND